jgi:uncharacterized membrane protein
MSIAIEFNLMIKLAVRPGDFLFEKIVVVEIFYSGKDSLEDVSSENMLDRNNPVNATSKDQSDVTEKISKGICDSLIVGAERTHVQDVRHAFDEVVDIAVRVVSPGINDPFTAINCVDRIWAALATLQDRQIPDPRRFDENGVCHVLATPINVDECIEGSLGMIQNHATDSPLVLRRIEQVLESLDNHASRRSEKHEQNSL